MKIAIFVIGIILIFISIIATRPKSKILYHFKKVPCDNCNGTGKVKCPICKGLDADCVFKDDEGHQNYFTCPMCRGDKVLYEEH